MSNGMRKRGSALPGLLLIVLGALFLLDRFDPAFGIGRVIRTYWPVLIILWGVAKLVDHLAVRGAGEPRPALLSGGEAALMILLAFVLTGFVFRDWVRDHSADFNIEIPPFYQSYSQSRELSPQPLQAGAHLSVETELGDISVHAGESNELRVQRRESAWAPSESAASEQLRNLDVIIEREGNFYRLHPVHQDAFGKRVRVDLDVTVPKSVSIDASTGHGDVQIAGVAGSVIARTANGDVEIHDVAGDVAADVQRGDAKILGIAGSVKLTGRGNDLDLSNISGDATVEGAFLGTIRASKIARPLRCLSPWADLTITHLAGRLEADNGDIQVSDASGPLKVIARNKDIDIENVLGRIEVVNTHGDVKVAFRVPPRDDLSVTNDSSDINVTLPAESSFGVFAVSRSGEVQTEFEGPALKASKEHESDQISGRIGSAGPMLNITTTYGTIHLRKAG